MNKHFETSSRTQIMVGGHLREERETDALQQ